MSNPKSGLPLHVMKFVSRLILDGWTVWLDRKTSSICGNWVQHRMCIVKRWSLDSLERAKSDIEVMCEEERLAALEAIREKTKQQKKGTG